MSQPSQSNLECPILLPTGRDAELVCKACIRHGIATVRCDTFDDLLEAIRQGCGPVIIASEALKQTHWQALKEWVENQPEWSELPLLILNRPGHDLAPLALLKTMPGATLIPRPLKEDTLLGVLEVGLESRQRQYQVQDLLEQLRQANSELDNRASQLQHLALVLTKAEEAERRRIAHILHDELQQLIAAARVALRGLLPQSRELDIVSQKAFKRVDSILQEAIDASRTLSHELSPPLLHHAGLGPALDQLADNTQAKYNINVETVWNDAFQDMDNTLRSFLFEAARELVFNAYKHSGSKSVTIRLQPHDNLVGLTVEDNGCGFDIEAYQSDHASPETGVGLFGLREQTEILGGHFKMDSQPGQGTCVAVSVPRQIAAAGETPPQEEAPATRDQAVGAEESARKTPLRILVVDDHRIMRHGLVSMLSEIDDFEVVGEADDGATALAEARQLTPDIVLMDVSLPGMSGIEVTKKIRAERPDTQVIGLSMFEEGEIARQMIEAGASSYLVKSGPSESLISALRACRHAGWTKTSRL